MESFLQAEQMSMFYDEGVVLQLVAEGRFSEAITRHSQGGTSAKGPENLAGRLVLVELLERTGRLREATAHLVALKKLSHASDTEKARLLLVEGLLSKQLGHPEGAISAFKRAYQLAERARAVELLCWCQLRLLAVAADHEGAFLGASLLGSLRSNVEKAAVPAVSIAYQIFLAEYYAKRSELAASRHHSDIAESVLASFSNYWLRGLLDLHQSCLSYLEGNYLDSLVAAKHALEASGTSGHLLTRLIAQADMAAAYLAVGQSSRARTCLLSALRQSDSEEQIYGLLLETLAEAQLISGDLAGCSKSLETARDLSTRLSQRRSAWHRNWNLRTEARLLQRSGRWLDSLSLIRSVPTREPVDSRSYPTAQLEAVEAIALAKLHRSAEARIVIRKSVEESLVTPKSYQGLVARASISLAAASEATEQVVAEGTHALRVVGMTGETISLVELVDELIESMAETPHSTPISLEPHDASPLWRPTNIVSHIDRSSSVFPCLRPNADGLAAFVSSLADVVMHPLALGEETLRCLASLKWISCGVVVEYLDEDSRVVVSFKSQQADRSWRHDACALPVGWIGLDLGSKQGRRYELKLCPQESDFAVSRCHGLARLVVSLLPLNAKKVAPPSVSKTALLKKETENGESIFRSAAMLSLLASAERVAPLGITVLLTGESGTGKEVVAQFIHRASGAPQSAFVAFNCSTVPHDMLDSQLFGYRRGAFTGAVQGFQGVISAAEGGTLMLDEVGELPLETQPKLLRFLDSGEVQALGEPAPRKLRVRVIAATNADLEALVQKGRFREDLYYRLNVVRFRLPPLRERREEIEPLVAMFLSRYSSEFGKHDIRLSEAAREHLLLFSWPGNVRQLSHEIRRLVALSESGSMIDVQDLDSGLRGQSGRPLPASVSLSRGVTLRTDRKLSEVVREIEGLVIRDAIERAGGRLDVAARRLGLSRKGLYLKRQRLGLP